MAGLYPCDLERTMPRPYGRIRAARQPNAQGPVRRPFVPFGIDLAGSRAMTTLAVDSMSVRDHVGANPVDRGKPGSKLHLGCDGDGLPLTAAVTAANVADVTMLAAVGDDVPPVRTLSGRRRTRPARVHADKRGMTATPTVPGCGAVGSDLGSRGEGPSRRRGWDGTAGGWSGRCRG